jgi:hypothetical protein
VRTPESTRRSYETLRWATVRECPRLRYTTLVGVDETEPIPEQVLLAEPRPFSSREEAIIDFLNSGPLGRNELREQAATARVVATCSCSCPSVWIEADPSAPVAVYTEAETPEGRTDHVALTAYQHKTRGSTEVTLHVVNGQMFELEIWGHAYGVRPRVDVSKLERQ